MNRPPVGAVWGWIQRMAARATPDLLLPGGALIVSPHQDDESIGCGLLIAEKVLRDIPVSVAVATDGRKGWYSSMPRPTPGEIAVIRQQEWHRALDVLGVSRSHRFEFSFPDGALTEHVDELTSLLSKALREVRPSQVFVTRPGDPHPDHRILTLAVSRAVAETFDQGVGDPSVGLRPQLYTYRVYPGEGFWSDGRPSPVTMRALCRQLVRSIAGLRGRHALLLRARGSRATKADAIGAYDSQSRLLGGELRYVWKTTVELFWPMESEDLHEQASSPAV